MRYQVSAAWHSSREGGGGFLGTYTVKFHCFGRALCVYGCLLFLMFLNVWMQNSRRFQSQAKKQTLENTVVFSKFEGKVLYIK